MRRMLSAVLSACLGTALIVAAPAVTEVAAAPAADPVASKFTAVSPVRVLNTRTGSGPVGDGGTVTLDLSARVPATATAVVLNVSGVALTAPTFVTVFPAGTTRPAAAHLNLTTRENRSNQVTVAVGPDRRLNLYNDNGSLHLVADLFGYYASDSGAGFTPLPARRSLDTRPDNQIGAGATRVISLSSQIPESATAVTFTLTGTNPTASTFVTAWPTGTSRPATWNLNLFAGETRSNQVTVAVGTNRQVSLYNNAGSVHVAADLVGFYTPDYGAAFLPMSPSRVLDTRNGTGTGGSTAPVGPDAEIQLGIADGVPLTATGVVLNLAGTAATSATSVTAWPSFEVRPDTSTTLSLAAGRTIPGAATVAFARQRGIELHNASGSVHLIADLVGVFTALDTPCTTDCVLAWGWNDDRQLGTAEAVFFSATPKPVMSLSGVRAIAGGRSGNAYALRTDGTVWAWGSNEIGQLGNGWSGNAAGSSGGSMVPVPVLGLTDVTAVAGANFAAFALRADGTVWSWGANTLGLLGNGDNGFQSSTPARVSGLTGAVAITASFQTAYALRADGTVWAWGSNSGGELGTGSAAESSPVPVQVTGLTGVTAISAGGFGAYALRGDGTVWAWGDNHQGQLGNGVPCAPDPAARCESRVPIQVPGLTGVTIVAGGDRNGYAARGDGTVVAWGSSVRGALGNGVDCNFAPPPCESRVPVPVSELTGVTRLSSFGLGAYAIRTDGSVWGWGNNENRQLADETLFGNAPTPIPIAALPAVSDIVGSADAGYALVPQR